MTLQPHRENAPPLPITSSDAGIPTRKHGLLTGTNATRVIASVATVLTLAAGNLRADNDSDEQHPLDKDYQAELAKPQPEQDIVRRFEVKWDAELNHLYQEMLSGLPPKAAATLRNSQREWIKFRDAQYGMIGELFTVGDGGLPSMYVGFAKFARMDVTRQRVLDLTKRWDTYKMLRSELGDPVIEMAEELPLGKWNHPGSGLLVWVQEIGEDNDRSTGVNVGNRHVRVQGPPPPNVKSYTLHDDILVPHEAQLAHGMLTIRGDFMWDRYPEHRSPEKPNEIIEVSVVWNGAEADLEIRGKRPGETRFPAGTYLLKQVKSPPPNEP